MSEIPIGAIRSEGEGDRSAEFKESRQLLIDKVNNWLGGLSKKRDAAEPLSDGRLILDKPRILTTDLGRSGPVTRAIVEERFAGISLTGDGIEDKFILQSVQPIADKGVLEITEVQGSDPLAVAVYRDTFSLERQLEVLAEFGMRSIGNNGGEQYFRFTVTGDGRVSQGHLSEKGVHTTQPVRDVEGLEMANVALDQVIN